PPARVDFYPVLVIGVAALRGLALLLRAEFDPFVAVQHLASRDERGWKQLQPKLGSLRSVSSLVCVLTLCHYYQIILVAQCGPQNAALLRFGAPGLPSVSFQL